MADYSPPHELDCDWSIGGLTATYFLEGAFTRFEYVRTNPLDANIRVLYGPGGLDPVSELTSVPDDGKAKCTEDVTCWDSMLPIPSSYNVVVQIWDANKPTVMKAARTTVR